MQSVLRFFKTGPNIPPLDDPAEIDRRYRRGRMASMLALTLGYGCAYTCRLSFAVAKKPLVDAGMFSASELGLIGSVFFYTYAFGKFTNGFLADHANLRRFFSFGVFVSALINLFIGHGEYLLVWAILWGMNGWFQAFGAPSGAVMLSRWFGNRERGLYYGIFSTCHSIGEGMAFILLPLVVSLCGWHGGFWAPGAMCVLVAAVLYMVMYDRPQVYGLPPVIVWRKEHDPLVSAGEGGRPPESTLRTQFTIFRMPAIWVLGFASASLYVTRYAVNSWGIFYLQEAKGFTIIEAGGLLWANTMAGIAGSVTFGFISDRLFRALRPPVNLIFGLLQIGALGIILFAPPGNTTLLVVALVVYGFSISGLLASLGGLFAIDIAPKQAAGAAMGFIGIFSYMGAALQELLSGYLIEAGTTMIDGARHYDFSTVILFWFGASILSMLLALCLWRVKMNE